MVRVLLQKALRLGIQDIIPRAKSPHVPGTSVVQFGVILSRGIMSVCEDRLYHQLLMMLRT